MEHVPQDLVAVLGEPRKQGKWYVFGKGKSWYDRDVFVWTPGMRFAKNPETEERIRVCGDHPIPFWSPKLDTQHVEPLNWEWPSDEVTDYLLERGLTHNEITDYAVSMPDKPWLAVFPIMEDDILVAWHGRRMDDGEPKYDSGRSSEGWLTGHQTVWGLDRMRPGEPVWVCQGPFDAFYFPRGVAVMTDRVHETQAVKILDRKPSGIFICHDNKEPLRPRELRKLTDKDLVEIYPKPYADDFGEMVRNGVRYEEGGD
jgi:hypothetical protein